MISTKKPGVNFLYLLSAITTFFVITSFAVNAEDTPEVKAAKERLRIYDAKLANLELPEIIAEVGKSFLGTEYVAGTLDKDTDRETLVINVTGLDCVTFVENVLAISNIIRKGSIDFDSYKDVLKLIRYRSGEINNYSSRLHYFTDWIYDNQEKGIVKDITGEIGGEKYSKTINFMTTHTDSYVQLKGNSEYIEEMRNIEERINNRNHYYIRKEDVNKYYDELRTGDIIATTTNKNGLDVTHTGFIYKEDGKTKFMHASITKGEIVISKEDLKEYLKSNKKQTGIIVARPL